MATWIERGLLLLFVSACGPGELEILSEGPPLTNTGFTCADGTSVQLSETEHHIARVCLGIECAASNTPEDPACVDPAQNKVLNTCVSAFFSCYRASGACTPGTIEGTATFTNGALIEEPEDADGATGFLELTPAGSDEACVTTLQFTTERRLWARFLD